MEFPTIPENWQELSAVELRELAAQIRQAFEALPEKPTAEQREIALAAVQARKGLLEEAAAKEAFAAVEMSEDEEAAEETEDDSAEDEAAADDEAGDEADDEADDEASDSTDVELADKAPVKRKAATSTDLGARPDPTAGVRSDVILSRGEHGDRKAGAQFSDWSELTAALIDAASSISPTSRQKVQVGYVKGNFSESQILGENMVDNLRRFNSEEIMAAFCAPATPVYDMHCWNTDRRPVRNSLPQFRPDARGSVSIFPSPSLSDITDQAPAGVGIWDSDDDDSQTGSDPSVKECAVIECGSPTIYQLYGVWRCLTIQNLLAMTFPELVEAWLNRLAAAHARLAETQLLEAMGSNAIAVQGAALGYGAAVTFTSQILELLALHQEQERWDSDGMEGWLPRWVRSAMKMDLMRRRNTSGTVSVPTDAAIDQMFRNVGVEPHFFIDTPTWSSAVPEVVTNGDLNSLPDTINILLAPRGKFAVMDRGELSIGVTGNNIYRDNNSNAHNQFTMFFENFEGIVNTDNCPAYLLEVEDLCYNGIQIDDVLLDCVGELVDAG